MSIYVETFSDEDDLKEMQKNKPAMEAMLKDLYHKVSLPSLNEHQGMQLQVVHQEVLSSESKGPGFFAIVKMPEKFKCARYDDGRYLDSYMGHLLFFDDQQLVVLAHDFPDLGSLSENIVLIRTALQQMQNSYINESN